MKSKKHFGNTWRYKFLKIKNTHRLLYKTFDGRFGFNLELAQYSLVNQINNFIRNDFKRADDFAVFNPVFNPWSFGFNRFKESLNKMLGVIRHFEFHIHEWF